MTEKKTAGKWSAVVTDSSHALVLEHDVFKKDTPQTDRRFVKEICGKKPS